MVSDMTADAIEALLHEELIARIAYVDRRGVPYIAPIAYAYDGDSFYGYSMLGSKIEHMGVHPEVCVEVDRITDAANWCSVVARGTFEPLHGDAGVDAVQRISERMRTVAAVEGAPTQAFKTFVAREGGDGIAYRIRVSNKHGRQSTT